MPIITKINQLKCPDCGYPFGDITDKKISDENFSFIPATKEKSAFAIFTCPYDKIEIHIPVEGTIE